MNSGYILYIFPLLILAEFCFLLNDLLALLTKRHLRTLLGATFSEVKFTYDLVNINS